jgi:hypothetical protein
MKADNKDLGLLMRDGGFIFSAIPHHFISQER